MEKLVDVEKLPASRTWTKANLVNHVAGQRGYRSFLQISTPASANHYLEVDRSSFKLCHRLMYRCPTKFDDGLKVNFRSKSLDISECMRQIRKRGHRYDIILVDPWHEYHTSWRDMCEAFDLLTRRGTMIVHECLRPGAKVDEPDYVGGDWCGVTYKAFFDFIALRATADYQTAGIDYQTVDVDSGCGLIRKRSVFSSLRHWWGMPSERKAMFKIWSAFGKNYDAAFQFLEKNKKAIANLYTLEDFIREEEVLSNSTMTGRRQMRRAG